MFYKGGVKKREKNKSYCSSKQPHILQELEYLVQFFFFYWTDFFDNISKLIQAFFELLEKQKKPLTYAIHHREVLLG